MIKIRCLMKDDARLVFSMPHPMATCRDGAYDRYTCTEAGMCLCANVMNCVVERVTRVNWAVGGREPHRRTVSSLINIMIRTELVLEECQESRISDKMRKSIRTDSGRPCTDPILFSSGVGRADKRSIDGTEKDQQGRCLSPVGIHQGSAGG